MSYQVIARKFRPLNFSQLVGQEHVTTTLRNALVQDRLHHALLFTGPRGTGKTSSARILAKSLRCPNAVDFVPCNQCPYCEDISVSRSVDVIEIDGASNNGVDAVRELRDSVGFMPSSGKYKIYIIDEVHMLSTAAFNALLKTLEEPPNHVVFVLATTEVHKLPATILSRLQRYDFRRIPTRVIADQLRMICSAESIEAEEDAIWMVARQADGSMRDSQSLLEQVVTFSRGRLTTDCVSKILGLTDHALLAESIIAIVNRNPSALHAVFQKMNEISVDPSLFIENLIQDLRHITMVGLFGDESYAYVDRPDSDLRLLKDLSGQLSDGDLQLLFDMALKGAQDIQRAAEPRWVLEMTLLRLASAPRWMDFQRLQTQLSSINSSTVNPSKSQAQIKPASPQVGASAAHSVQPMHSIPVSADLPPQEKWFEIIQKMKRVDSLLAAKLEPIHFVKLEDNTIELAIPTKMSFLYNQLHEKEVLKKIEGYVEQFWGERLHIRIVLAKDTQAPTAQKIGQEKAQVREAELLEKAALNPKVASFNKIFQGKVQGFAPQNPKNK